MKFLFLTLVFASYLNINAQNISYKGNIDTINFLAEPINDIIGMEISFMEAKNEWLGHKSLIKLLYEKYINYGNVFYIDTCIIEVDTCIVYFNYGLEALTPIEVSTVPSDLYIEEKGVLKFRKKGNLIFYDIIEGKKSLGGLNCYFPQYKYFVIDKSKRKPLRKFKTPKKREKNMVISYIL